MPQFGFVKGTLKLKDIDSIAFVTENIAGNAYLHFDILLRNGRVKQGGGARLPDIEKPHQRTTRFTLKLPSERAWDRLKPNELTVGLGVVSAKWNLKDKPR